MTQEPSGHISVRRPIGLKFCLDDLLAADKTEVLLHGPVVSAVRTVDSKITAVEFQERRGRLEFAATAFVDSQGTVILHVDGGASRRYGNHGMPNLGSCRRDLAGFRTKSTLALMSGLMRL